MDVASLSISPRVKLTLIYESGRWRFGFWCRRYGTPIAAPSPADRARLFLTFREAADFFRSICPSFEGEPEAARHLHLASRPRVPDDTRSRR